MTEGGDGIHFAGVGAGGAEFGVLDGYWGGWGARAGKDGIDGVARVHSGSYGCIPAEVLERQVPVVIEGFGFVPDTAGPGRFRGSLAIFRSWRFLGAGAMMVRTLNLGLSEGLHGGGAGSPSRTELDPPRQLERRSHVHLEVEPGQRIWHATAGVGGCGDPFERDPALVLADVVEGKLSRELAREQYGVAIDPAGPAIDVAATAGLRGVDIAATGAGG
ncbi:MAG: hydantoinase B/oxoprolinase family protein [Solirubrobacterales bacterium]